MIGERGRFRLEGLIEGPCPADDEVMAALRGWEETTRRAGLDFALELEAGRFSLLGTTDRRLRSDESGGVLERRVHEAAGAFLELLPLPWRARAFSTLRSIRFEDEARVETVYALGEDGRLAAESREREAGPPPPRRRDRRRSWIAALAALALAVLATLWWRGGRDGVDAFALVGWSAEAPEVSVPAELGELVHARARLRDGRLEIGLERTASCPDDLASYLDRRRVAEAAGDAATWTALEAAFHGRLHVIGVDEDDRVVGSEMVQIAPAFRARAQTTGLDARTFAGARRLVVEPR